MLNAHKILNWFLFKLVLEVNFFQFTNYLIEINKKC